MTENPSKSPFSDEELKKVAKAKIMHKLALKIHAIAFICVNVLLVAINFFTSTPVWFVYPLSGWFIGIVAHCSVYIIYARGVIGGAKIGLLINAATYSASVPALFVINFFSNFSYPWFLWPTAFWLLGIIIQAIAWKQFGLKRDNKGSKKSWIERGVEKELEKIRRKRSDA